ncbi:elongin-A3-like [Phodopus roborovskii]|uniref:elongin-A3-like n=1 Tax=Phodopus roborovskii TaxID=109678 RepID=UPI0021E4D05B|nr:elongin-A3-like [Phodopus roborovskii]
MEEAPSRLEALQKLRERLCTETEPSKLYSTLKKLSRLPVLGDTLEEIGFRKTIKVLKKQQLLLPFAKDLAAQWSEGSHFGPRPEPRPQDFASQSSATTEPRRDSPEALEPASRPQGGGGREVLEVSGSSPQRSAPRSPSSEPAGRKRPRGSFGGRQLAAESQVQVRGGKPPQGGVGAPWRLQGVKALRGKPAAGPAKRRPSPPREKTPGPWIREDQQAASLQARLDYHSSDSSPSSSAPAPPPPGKRKRKSNWKAEAQSPGAEVPRGESHSCSDLNLLLDDDPFPELTSSLQACFSGGEGPEDSSLHTDREAAPWARRATWKTPVYSGRTPARALPRKSHQGRFANPDRTWETHSQPAPQECGLWRQQEDQSRTCKPTNPQTETQTHLRLQQSSELRLKALTARIQSSQAKKHQDRQTKLISFHALTADPGQHADSAPRREDSPENLNCLSQGPGTDLVKRAPRPALGGRDQTRAKKAAPLMAKALKDYKNRWSRK